ncbi:MAG TPA: D-2-hydroxyacid dehydrogenase [Alphaproteobacteria bacterium]|nr:D-2-hydroxyacid dehydrogenase [Alphaproteobacteria bacterium]
MASTVALYEPAYEQIRPRLEALGLDIAVLTFDQQGRLFRDGAEVAPEQTDVDYLWLSNFISRDKAQEPVFDLVLRLKSIGVLQTFNAGLDHPVYKKIAAKGARICNSSAQAVAISEYVFAQMLNLFHPLDRQREQQRDRVWQVTPFREIWRTHWLIVGFGPIGREVATKVKAFGGSTAVVRRSPETGPLVDKAGTLADLPELTPEADVIVLACPLNDQTRGFADASFFSGVKEGAILVNIARGGLIDDAALITALDNGRLAHAVLDVFHEEPLPADNPLWQHPKVRVTPHTSFAGNGGAVRWQQLFLDNLPRFVRGEALVNEVAPDDI